MAWDRSASLSRVLAVLFALHFAYAHGLWTPSTVGTFVGHVASRYGGYSAPIYSLVHHRPMEVCDTYVADKTGHMAAVAATPAAISAGRNRMLRFQLFGYSSRCAIT